MRLVPTLLLAGFCGAAAAQLTAPEQRISDRAIHADHKAYEAMQARIKALNDRGSAQGQSQGPRVADYHLSKAQCWLDVSFHEYTRNDRSPFPQEALQQAERLVSALEARSTPPDDTPLVNNADQLRKDLWDAAAQVKQHSGYRCAAQQVACAEVELVHAGNEHKQQGWRHAKPYVQIAEDLISEARAAADRCTPPPPPPPVAAVPPPPPAPKFEPLNVSARVLFNFDKSDAANIRPNTRAELDQLLARIKQDGVRLESVRVVGHADRLRSPAARDYNVKLAQRRAQTVADLMVAAGVEPGVIAVDSRGDAEQVADCKQRFKSKRELEECLLENRRVTIEVRGQRRVS